MLNIAVFASGQGSNFRAIQEAILAGNVRNATIVLVISNNSDAGALELARSYGIPAVHCSRKQFQGDEEFTTKLSKILEQHGANFIVLAGYMKKIDSSLIRRYKNRMLNIHPALLPAFGGAGMYGMHVHEAVLAQRATVTGATVHIVDEEYDRGPIVLQREVNVSPDDTPESLSKKVLRIEHELYPEAVRLFAEGQIEIDGEHVKVLNAR
ncbi:MAG TPA: phosphoribosylglycinamide formyltransferase [Bacteroidota bacterium]|jgi:phosphoribosylglycinamide formyltransferase-1|nr:phosphoribosylglycinamide formyltransferase [Bacteroidota bacterium]